MYIILSNISKGTFLTRVVSVTNCGFRKLVGHHLNEKTVSSIYLFSHWTSRFMHENKKQPMNA